MPAPTTSSPTSTVPNSGVTNIDALLAGVKWGNSGNKNINPLIISYSFPWINGLNAVFSAPAGAAYSKDGEQNATQRFGLSTAQQTAATLALNAWSDVANIKFEIQSETSTNVGDIRFAFTSASSISDAWGYASYPNSYWPIGGDIWINAKHGSDTDWTIGSANFESLMHEVGHALGIKHPFEDGIVLSSSLDNTIYTIMSYTDINDIYPNAGYVNGKYDWLTYYINRETPMVLDIAAIQYIYGANNNHKTGDDTYTFDPTKPFFKTIWDAGGKDTISVSNFSLGCIIDLTPGNYSSLSYPRPSDPAGATVTYDGTNNLGIAFNCIIENAIGGMGNDKLTGNNANNNLDGGPGNDIMYGGMGNDIFDWDQSKRSGNDTMYGGMGDDVYVLDSTNDIVIEVSNEGNDTIWASFSYSIASLTNIENLYGFGSESLNLTGNSRDNYFVGGSGNDLIDGGAGIDHVLYYDDKFADYTITSNSTGFTIKNKSLSSDTLINIEKLIFSDKTIDLSTYKTNPTYTLTALNVSVNEGATATFNLLTTNVAAGTTLTYSITGVSSDDLASGLLAGTVVVGNDGKASINIPIKSDNLTEGAETLTVTLLGTNASTILNDTSTSKANSMNSNLFPTFTGITVVDSVISPISPASLLLNGSSNSDWVGASFRNTKTPDNTLTFIAFPDEFNKNIENNESISKLANGNYELSWVTAFNKENGLDYARSYYGGTYYSQSNGAILIQEPTNKSLIGDGYHNFNFSNYTVSVHNTTTPLLISIKATANSGILNINYEADFTDSSGDILFVVEPLSERGTEVDLHTLYITSKNSNGVVSKIIPSNFPDGKYVITALVSSKGFLTEGTTTTSYNQIDKNAWVAKVISGKPVTQYSDTYTLNSNDFQFEHKAIKNPIITTQSNILSVIVDKGVLGKDAIILKNLNQTITFTDGVISSHVIEYAGSKFNYSDIDSLITTVTQDGAFTPEFRKEIADLLPAAANFSYQDTVKLVGIANIDNVILYVAGADGNFVS